MTYHIYHIPGQKIGVTRNLNKRVTEEQGFLPDEYEVLFTTDDIDEVSQMEIELQQSYGYKVDRQLYKDLFKPKQMRVNATEQTSTFPVPVSKLKGRLMDSIGHTWVTPQGYRFTITASSIPWLVSNARESMFNPNRCYVYNEAFNKHMQSLFEPIPNEDESCCVGDYEPFDNIRCWAKDRGIYASGDVKTQYVKLMEEAGELAKAILKEDDIEFVDAIGDCVVVLTNLAYLGGYDIEECIEAAWMQIANRKGQMINGSFVKQTMPENNTISEYLKSKTATL